MNIRSFFLVCLLTVVTFCPFHTGQADQLYWISPTTAQQAARGIPPGSLFTVWISHTGDAPMVYLVHEVWVSRVPKAPKYATIQVVADQIAVSRPGRGKSKRSWDYQMAKPGPPQIIDLDLAYTYIPVRGEPGRFSNYSKTLQLEASVTVTHLTLPMTIHEQGTERARRLMHKWKKNRSPTLASQRSF